MIIIEDTATGEKNEIEGIVFFVPPKTKEEYCKNVCGMCDAPHQSCEILIEKGFIETQLDMTEAIPIK